ncbi:MAG: hypothetical protein MRJ96_14510 [Nitrospirales bacterium]|nr:hypothetical protein [Nitrospira sp.]MDR4502653.1 hypothetical protein [Nitrospirales bacterium]
MTAYSLCLFLFCLFTLPLIGVWLSGQLVLSFLEFPPRPIAGSLSDVSWVLFFASSLGILGMLTPFVLRLLTFRPAAQHHSTQQTFSLWGWASMASLLIFWILAWTRFSWMGEFQLHTFTPLWLSYIVLVNALTDRRTQHCLLRDYPTCFLGLFPLSAMYWWVFEYLNRFAQNWHYVPQVDVDGLTYFLVGSLSFSTVLPAVYCTYEWLQSFPRLSQPFQSWRAVPVRSHETWRWFFVALACLGLIGIGLWPKLLYPLIWLSPLLLLLGLQKSQNRDAWVRMLGRGDWRPIVIPSMAGLLCGLLWELWNSQSLAHWEYSIPYLHAYQIFEMPVLGYAGYVPFGLACVICAQLLATSGIWKSSREKLSRKKTVSLKMAWQTPWHHTKNI